MSDASSSRRPSRALDFWIGAVRWSLGALFLYLGLSKALQPEQFLKLVREYGVWEGSFGLNAVAAGLPWFEVACGMLLLLGVAVRGTALVLMLTLAAFTALIVLRAANLHATGGLPFCAIKFDCGCGAGEVLICRKLAENAALIFAAIGLVISSRRRFCLRHTLLD